uniref:Uncharacterized protein n=1 Tax=Setaria viridis TaxID=4556 RepID=A0A4U6WAC6_SETVI|nr:hypothetical protein SEVIR_1G135366v2 [Setaria viridis]
MILSHGFAHGNCSSATFSIISFLPLSCCSYLCSEMAVRSLHATVVVEPAAMLQHRVETLFRLDY